MKQLTDYDLEWLDRIGVDDKRMKIILRNIMIVDRLKKFSPEIIHKAECLDDYHTGKAIKELVQKIMEGEKHPQNWAKISIAYEGEEK